MNPLKLFYRETALFLLKLLRHLAIQTMILLFVLVDVRVHRMFIDHSAPMETPLAEPASNATPKIKRRPYKKSKKLRRRTQSFLSRSKTEGKYR